MKNVKSINESKEYESQLRKLFSERLDYMMRLRNITNAQLGDMLYCSTSAIAGYRTGYRLPNIILTAQISDILDVTPDYLLGFSDEVKLQ